MVQSIDERTATCYIEDRLWTSRQDTSILCNDTERIKNMLRYREIKLQLKAMIDQLPLNGKLPSRAVLCKELDTTPLHLGQGYERTAG